MANKFGKGYYSDWYEMIQGVNSGCTRAFNKACQMICKEANERIRGGIYSGDHPTYERTNQMANIDYLKADVKGLECQFLYDNQEFMTLAPFENPEHHALSDDKGNGYNTQDFMDDIISPIHDDFMVDVRYYIQEEFSKIYRECCKEEGFVLN